MSDEMEKTMLEEATESLVRIQEFVTDSLPRIDELGSSMNFSDAVEPAKRLIELYRRLSVSALEDFPDEALSRIKTQCDADYQRFNEILEFDTSSQQNPATIRDSYIDKLEEAYDPAFTVLCQYISYSLHRSADFQRLDVEARSMLQKVKDEAEKTQKKLEYQQGEAEKILSDIRNTDSQQGVTQQAIYFQTESSDHNTDADKWEKRTIGLAITLTLASVGFITMHKWNWIAPQNTFETVQLVTGKILIFGILTYLLVLSAKNYLNHKHNSIVNKHRQNALMTYKAMVDATDDPGSREAILIQAASCIFNPQSTGYAQNASAAGVSGKSMVEILSKPVVHAVSGSVKPS